jgi:hypothetical protein
MWRCKMAYKTKKSKIKVGTTYKVNFKTFGIPNTFTAKLKQIDVENKELNFGGNRYLTFKELENGKATISKVKKEKPIKPIKEITL